MAVDITRHEHAPAPGTVLPSHFKYCYGCGPDHPSGLHLRIVVGDDLSVTGEFLVTQDHQGAAGLVHGGVLAAAFDELLGAANWLLLKPAVTGRLEVDFRAPVPLGMTVIIRGRIDDVAGRKVWTSGTAELPDGTLAAQAKGLFIQVPLEHFERNRGGPSPQERGWELNP